MAIINVGRVGNFEDGKIYWNNMVALKRYHNKHKSIFFLKNDHTMPQTILMKFTTFSFCVFVFFVVSFIWLSHMNSANSVPQLKMPI